MQSLGHHSTSFSSRNFSSSELRTAIASSDTLTGKGDGGAGPTSVDGPGTTVNNEGTAGLCVGKVSGFLYCGPLLASS